MRVCEWVEEVKSEGGLALILECKRKVLFERECSLTKMPKSSYYLIFIFSRAIKLFHK